ncbi:hypothetical protein M9458_054571 [Cirrhinus mrigala]|uniref:Uncharacterized protein n=1 Tax=Cirrhinus mrigala TaxID=683832 RepID=A0ABD0MMI8_CIRMR
MPKDGADSFCGGPSVSFGAPGEDQMSIVEGLTPDEADDSAKQLPSVVAAESEADAELAAMLLRAAKSIGLDVRKAPSADPLRLDDWFLYLYFLEVGLFGDTVEDFAQQFSAVQKQTEAIKHILPQCESTKPPVARPSSSCCRGRPRDDSDHAFATTAGSEMEGMSPVPLIPLARRLGAWLVLPNRSLCLIRTIRLRYAIQFGRCLPRYRGVLFTSVCSETDASVLCGDCSSPGKGRNRACPSSRDEIGMLQSLFHHTKEELWVTNHPGPSSSELVPSQGAVQDVNLKAHSLFHSSPGLVRSHRAEGRVLSCLDPSSTQTISSLCFRGSGQSRGGCPYPAQGAGHLHPRQLADKSLQLTFFPVSLLAQTLCKIREDGEQVLLVAPHWPTRTWFADSPSLEDSPDGVCSLNGVPFHREDPRRCSVGVVLSFLQEKLERRLSPSTLKVYAAAIAAYHDAVDGLSLEKHHLVVRFLRSAREAKSTLSAPHPLLESLRGPCGPSERSL